MSYTVGTLVDAENIQDDLNALWQFAPDVDMAVKVPFTQYVMSPTNRGLMHMSVAPGRGKVRTVEVIYMQDLGPDDGVVDVENPSCPTSGNTPGEKSETYSIDTTANRARNFTFTLADLKAAKTENATYFNRLLLKSMLALEVDVNKKSAAELAVIAAAGGFSADTGSWDTGDGGVAVSGDKLTIKTRVDSSINPYPYTARLLQEFFMYQGYSGSPMIFSGTLLNSYALDGLTFGAADYGIDLERAINTFGFASMFDTHVAAAAGGASYNVAVAPGAVQLLTWNSVGWTDGMTGVREGANYYHFSAITPRAGLPVDVFVNDDCGTITVQVVATTKLVGLPDDIFHSQSPYSGVNMTNKIQVVNV
jgi:hypothetical protein